MYSAESLWILARTPFPKAWIMKEARSVVESLGLKMSSLRGVSQGIIELRLLDNSFECVIVCSV